MTMIWTMPFTVWSVIPILNHVEFIVSKKDPSNHKQIDNNQNMNRIIKYYSFLLFAISTVFIIIHFSETGNRNKLTLH